MRIVVDAMGGDYAPKNVILGTIDALTDSNSRFEVILTGDKSAIEKELADASASSDLPITIHHTSQIITMEDSPATAVKTKSDSSMVVGLSLCKQGIGDAFLSAGNTGAQMAASTFILGRIPGVLRPTISAFFPHPNGISLILDVGANVDCKPEHLVQFAQMGSIFISQMENVSSPKVGLLSVGEEDTKGNDVTKETNQLLKTTSNINFIGNIEGRDIFKGTADVMVCDGFVGNIILKMAESISHILGPRFKSEMKAMNLDQSQMMLVGGLLKQVMKPFDYEEVGGVPLLGLNGVSIIGHGGSSPKAIKNMIFEAEKMVNLKVNDRIQKAINPA